MKHKFLLTLSQVQRVYFIFKLFYFTINQTKKLLMIKIKPEIILYFKARWCD